MSIFRWYLPPSLLVWGTIAAALTITVGVAYGALVAAAYTLIDELGLS